MATFDDYGDDESILWDGGQLWDNAFSWLGYKITDFGDTESNVATFTDVYTSVTSFADTTSVAVVSFTDSVGTASAGFVDSTIETTPLSGTPIGLLLILTR